MPLTKTPTSSLSGSHITYPSLPPFNPDPRYSDGALHQASLVSNSSRRNPEISFSGGFSGDLYGSPIPCHSTSLGDRQNNHLLSYL